MTLDEAIRLTEILLAIAFIQQSLEHLCDERALFAPRLALSALLLPGIQAPWVCLGLVVLGLLMLKRFQGPYNGGSDRMSLLILCCLTLALFLPSTRAKELVFGYMALQVVLSYFIAGWVKIVNPQWRQGRALQDVFLFSAYPVSEALRAWADRPRRLMAASWTVMVFELTFPFALATQPTLIAALAIAGVFHLANTYLFGLNRFFWIWAASWPSLLWLQARVF